MKGKSQVRSEEKDNDEDVSLQSIPDGVTSAQASPVRDGAVLASLLREADLDLEALDSRHLYSEWKKRQQNEKNGKLQSY